MPLNGTKSSNFDQHKNTSLDPKDKLLAWTRASPSFIAVGEGKQCSNGARSLNSRKPLFCRVGTRQADEERAPLLFLPYAR